MKKASGTWSKENGTTPFGELKKIYTFRARSGFTAVMTTVLPGPKYYRCTFKDPQGNEAIHVNEHGRRITGMEMHLHLGEAKQAVQERALELRRQRPRTSGCGASHN